MHIGSSPVCFTGVDINLYSQITVSGYVKHIFHLMMNQVLLISELVTPTADVSSQTML